MVQGHSVLSKIIWGMIKTTRKQGIKKKKDTLEFTGGPVVRTLLSLPRAQILFLVRELKSHTFTYVSITLGLMGIIDGLLET